ncbi:MAG TPA: GTP cyclohydrolase FolE2 [Spirochaetota bacterium]|nr:GTP cyclohydrolase FolE2 [Spirochaetota bacterium]HPI89997.1 GTP cyclohydrolase FolE2 [Spirochaetota bacterium]HPR47279.1 GTP cyclohydrolase FolE2 [Spirochaetota bacterium]
MEKKKLKDIQSEPDTRNIPINKVGVKDISYPVVVLDRDEGIQHTVARVNMYVNLPHHFRGTHMSRFVEILNRYRKGISTTNIREILDEMKVQLDAETAHFEIEFPYFVTKKAPVSGEEAKMEYTCRLTANSDEDFYQLEVRVPVLSLCPCSREISKYGAHNQRSIMSVKIKAHDRIWIEDIIAVAEASASSDIYSILKREDEKFITERSYENPVFVEDMVRNAAQRLMQLKGLLWFSVESENIESIHNHSAYAQIEKDLP